jgi:hypothetical protein
VFAGAVLAVTVRPRVARVNARLHRLPITLTRSVPIGGRRQQPSTTRPGYGTRGCAIRSNQGSHADTCPQPGDNNLNRTACPDYRDWTPIRSLVPLISAPPHLNPDPSRTTRSWDL